MKMYRENKCAKIVCIFTFISVCIFALNSCNSDISDSNVNNTGESLNTETEPKTEIADVSEEYIYPEMGGESADFTFLAPTTSWFYYTDIIHENMTGEVLDDAIYMRNRTIEDKFNINFVEVSLDIGQIYNQVRTSVTAGEDVYDAVFCPAFGGGNIGSLITQNMFYNLREITTLNLSQKWWNQTMNKEAAVGKGDKLYYAGCDINIMTLQSVSCIFFNQDMMETLGMELPYNKVKEGKWTFDVLSRYMKDAANLNGAESFAWELNGPAVYGMTSYEDSATALLAGSQERFINIDSSGNPLLAVESERFINVLEKIKSVLHQQDGAYLYANQAVDTGFHCEPVFRNGRAMMVLDELKAADVFREMDDVVGILPIPKYDENQEEYYSHLIFAAPVLVIPVTNPRDEFTGAVLDAMAYLSNKDITPVFFDVTVSQKRLRNDESIDMLQIIKNSGSFEIGCAYGWVNSLYDSIGSSIGQGRDLNIISQIEKTKNRLIKNIENTMELFN